MFDVSFFGEKMLEIKPKLTIYKLCVSGLITYIAIVKIHITGRLKIFKKQFVTVKRTIVKVSNLPLNNHMKYPCHSFIPFVELLSPK